MRGSGGMEDEGGMEDATTASASHPSVTSHESDAASLPDTEEECSWPEVRGARQLHSPVCLTPRRAPLKPQDMSADDEDGAEVDGDASFLDEDGEPEVCDRGARRVRPDRGSRQTRPFRRAGAPDGHALRGVTPYHVGFERVRAV